MALSRNEVRDLDRRAIEEFQIPGLLLMENAGLNLTVEILSDLQSQSNSKIPNPRPLIVCGRGNNGGDGFVLARHLRLAGLNIQIAFIDPQNKGPATNDALINYKIVRAMNLPLKVIGEARDLSDLYGDCSVLLCDAFLGTGIDRVLRPFAQTIVKAINEWPGRILAVDCPSGLDCDSGSPLGVAVRADRTVTMAAMKEGFQKAGADAYTGPVQIVPISAPGALLPEDAPRIPRTWPTL